MQGRRHISAAIVVALLLVGASAATGNGGLGKLEISFAPIEGGSDRWVVVTSVAPASADWIYSALVSQPIEVASTFPDILLGGRIDKQAVAEFQNYPPNNLVELRNRLADREVSGGSPSNYYYLALVDMPPEISDGWTILEIESTVAGENGIYSLNFKSVGGEIELCSGRLDIIPLSVGTSRIRIVLLLIADKKTVKITEDYAAKVLLPNVVDGIWRLYKQRY